MNRLVLTGFLALLTAGSALASNPHEENPARRMGACSECSDMSVLPRHVRCAEQAFIFAEATRFELATEQKRLEKAERRRLAERSYPTQKAYMQGYTDNYMQALLQFVTEHKAGKNPQVTEILLPKTVIFAPCRGGMLMYKFYGITNEVNSGAQEILSSAFTLEEAALNKWPISSAKSVKRVSNAKAEELIGALRETAKTTAFFKECLSKAGHKTESADGLRTIQLDMLGTLGDPNSFAIAFMAMQHFQEYAWVTDDLIQLLEKGFATPTFIAVKDQKMVGISNMRGVRK